MPIDYLVESFVFFPSKQRFVVFMSIPERVQCLAFFISKHVTLTIQEFSNDSTMVNVICDPHFIPVRCLIKSMHIG